MKKKLVIVSEKTRGHYQSGIDRLEKFEVVHFYKRTFSDMVVDQANKKFIRYDNIFDLVRKLKEEEPDLIQPLEPYYGYSRFGLPFRVLPTILATYWFCRKYRVPYFIHFLENILPEQKYYWPFSKIMKKIAGRIVKSSTMLFYVNEGARKNIEVLGGSEKAVYGLWGIWGVDRKIFSPPGITPKNQILFVGRISWQKGIFDLVEAIKIIKKDIPEVKCQIVGDGENLEKLKSMIKNSNLDKAITFHGEVADQQISKYYKSATVLLFPSKTTRHSAEQVGMVAIEAMACGVPVVAYDSGSIKEFVKNDLGFVVPESDVSGLAKKAAMLLMDDQLRAKLSAGANKYISENFDQEKNVKKLEEKVYRIFFDSRAD